MKKIIDLIALRITRMVFILHVCLVLALPLSSESIIMVTGDSNGNYHQGGIILQKVLSEGGINLELKNTDGSFQNVIELGTNQANLGIAQVDVLIGMAKYNQEYKNYTNNCLAIAPTELEYVHIIVNNKSNIKRVTDLKNKKVNLGSPNSGTAFSAGFILAYSIKGIDVTAPNFSSLDETESLQKVVTGELDAAFLTTTPNSSLLNDLSSDSDIRILGYNKKELPPNLKKEYHTMTIPAGGYPWLKESVDVPVTASFLLVSKSTPKGVMQKLIKIFYNNEEVLDSESHLWTNKASESYEALKKLGIPYHPLVDKYIKEKGK